MSRLIIFISLIVGTVEFYGQHVWRPGKLITDPSDPQKEKEAIKALQFIELHHVNHSVMKHNFIL